MLITTRNIFLKIILGVLIVRLCVYADIDTFKTTGISKESFSFSKVCDSFGVKDAILITKESSRKIDCMGKSFFISDFCYNKFKSSKDYAYPEFDPVSKKVNCYFASTVHLGLRCTKKFKKLCSDSKVGCLGLQKLYARNLELINTSLLESYPPILKCYFSKKNNSDLPSSLFETPKPLL